MIDNTTFLRIENDAFKAKFKIQVGPDIKGISLKDIDVADIADCEGAAPNLGMTLKVCVDNTKYEDPAATEVLFTDAPLLGGCTRVGVQGQCTDCVAGSDFSGNQSWDLFGYCCKEYTGTDFANSTSYGYDGTTWECFTPATMTAAPDKDVEKRNLINYQVESCNTL